MSEEVMLDRNWPGGAASRNGRVRLELQAASDQSPSPDPVRFWMTPGQALTLIKDLSAATRDALKDQVS